MVGLGTQDSFPEAQDFISTYGTRSFLMTWDPSGRSWAHFGITGQPAAVLLDADGRIIEDWFGPFPEDEVVELSKKAA